jgi:hypothetical protein
MCSSTHLPRQKSDIKDRPEPLVISSDKMDIGFNDHHTRIGQCGFVHVVEYKDETSAKM